MFTAFRNFSALLALFTTMSAVAADNQLQTTSSTFASKLSASYGGAYYGQALSSITSGHQPDGSSLLLYHSLKGKYKIGETQKFFINPRFGTTISHGVTFNNYNWRVGVSDSSIYQNGNFTFDGVAFAELPTDPSYYRNKTLVGLSAEGTAAYSMKRLTLATDLIVRPYILLSGAPDTARNFYSYVGPNAAYKFSDSLSAIAYYDLEIKHQKQQGFEFDTANYIRTGVSWQVAKAVTVLPQIMVALDEGVSTDTTSLYVELAATIL